MLFVSTLGLRSEADELFANHLDPRVEVGVRGHPAQLLVARHLVRSRAERVQSSPLGRSQDLLLLSLCQGHQSFLSVLFLGLLSVGFVGIQASS